MRINALRRDPSLLSAVLLAAIAAVVARVPQLGVPLLIDIPAYAVIGARIGDGDVPYRDLFDNKQPLIYGVLWAIDLIAPRSSFAIRFTGALVAAAAAAAMVVLLWRSLGPARAFLAGGLTGTLSATTAVEGLELNTEHLLLLFGTAAVLLPLSFGGRSASRRAIFLFGIVAGLAVITKAVAVLFFPAALFPLLWSVRKDRRLVLDRASQWALGLGSILLFVAALFAVAGALDDLWYANVTYNLAYIGSAPAPEFGSYFELPGPLDLLVLLALVVAVARLLSSKGKDVFTWTCVAWLIGGVLAAKQGRREYAHYYAPLIPAAVTLACATPVVRSTFSFTRRSWTMLALTVIAVALATRPLFMDVMRTFGRSPMENGRAIWGTYVDDTKSQAEVGAWIRERAASDDRLFVEDSWPAVYWGAGLEPATRYLYDFFIPGIEPDFYARLGETLTDDPPEWFVLFGDATFPGYAEVLQSRYETAHGRGTIFVMRYLGDP